MSRGIVWVSLLFGNPGISVPVQDLVVGMMCIYVYIYMLRMKVVRQSCTPQAAIYIKALYICALRAFLGLELGSSQRLRLRGFLHVRFQGFAALGFLCVQLATPCSLMRDKP